MSTKDKDLIDFINHELDAPKSEPEDLGVPLPTARSRGQWLRDGSSIHNITEPPPRPRRLPQPPYRCICDTVFATAEEFLAHRHPGDPIIERRVRDMAEVERKLRIWKSWDQKPPAEAKPRRR
jgi:hypothetical protein